MLLCETAWIYVAMIIAAAMRKTRQQSSGSCCGDVFLTTDVAPSGIMGTQIYNVFFDIHNMYWKLNVIEYGSNKIVRVLN
jgi:hypothetical protein